MSTGLSGTPMPSYRDSLSEEDRWALAYYILSLSAFKDPLTGEPLQISDADRAALDDPKLQAGTPESAYVPKEASPQKSAARAPRDKPPPKETEPWMDFEVIGPYAVALIMSLGALCVFIWGVLSGAFNGADEAALRFYEREMESDAHSERPDTPRKQMSRPTTTTSWRIMAAAPSRRGSATSRFGCWSSTSCCSSGASTTPTTTGAGSGRDGFPGAER